MSDQTAKLAYLTARAAGKTCRDASRLAGYASRPPWPVRELAAKIPSLRREGAALCVALDSEVDQLTREIEARIKRRAAKIDILLLCDVLTAQA